jgi:transglutaminase-like putative cysteine protease
MSIPDGVEGVKATLRAMSEFVKQGKKTPAIREKALALTQDLPQKDRLGEIKALFLFVRDNIRYVRDINDVETLYSAENVLNNEAGDCDDKCILLASLLESIGHPTRFCAVGFQAGSFSHVFVDTNIGTHRPTKWLSLDATEPQPMGWRPPGIVTCLPWYN